MRKADLINKISDKTGIAKVDVLVTLESFFKEILASYSNDAKLINARVDSLDNMEVPVALEYSY